MSNRAESFLVGLAGDGVTPSLTPPMHEREAEVQGLRHLYRSIDLTDLGLPGESVGELLTSAYRPGFNGLNITHPCKQLVQVAEPAGFNVVEVRAADSAGLETLPGQLGFAARGRHRTRNVQLWTMGHARVINNEESFQDPRAAGAPAFSALGFDADPPVAAAARPRQLRRLRRPQRPVRHPVKYDHLHELSPAP